MFYVRSEAYVACFTCRNMWTLIDSLSIVSTFLLRYGKCFLDLVGVVEPIPPFGEDAKA